MAKRTKKPKAPREIPFQEMPYRPYEGAPHLGEILGQDRALGLLDGAIRSGKLHHAWIFQGPEGVGKFSTALALARVLLDPTCEPDLGGQIRPQAGSPVQRLIDAGTHPDLHVIRRTLAVFSRKSQVRSAKQVNIPLEVIREFLLEPASRTRAMSGDSLAHKVLIVDEAHHLAREGQNAMLKALEEPPEGTVMILVTSRESRLLTTVRSRCQQVGFSPLGGADMGAVLDRLGVQADPWLVEMAGGSPGECARMASLGLGEWRADIEGLVGDLSRGRYPPGFGTVCARLIDEAAKRQVEGDPRASKESANRDASGLMLQMIARRASSEMDVGGESCERWADVVGALRECETLISQNVPMLFAMDRLGLALHDALCGDIAGC